MTARFAPHRLLSFCWGSLVLIISGTSVMVPFLARHDSLHYLVGWVLGIAALFIFAILAYVGIVGWLDPMRLQLDPVTGETYITNRRVTLGDSDSPVEKKSILPEPLGEPESDDSPKVASA